MKELKTWFGIDGKPCLHKDGNAGWKVKYDERGNWTECALFGVDGKPCLDKEGTAGWKAKYDERGNRIEEVYFGVDGKPCLSKLVGGAKLKFKYNESGNLIEVTYFDVNGKELRWGMVCKNIFPNTQALALGVQTGDIWIRIGTFECLKANITDIQNAVQSMTFQAKTLIVARKEKDVYRILTFDFQRGMMGILYGPGIIPANDLHAIMKAYSEWRKLRESR